MTHRKFLPVVLVALVMLVGCVAPADVPPSAAPPTATPTPPVQVGALRGQSARPAQTTPPPTDAAPLPPPVLPTVPTFLVLPDADPFAQLSVDALAARAYGGRGIALGEVIRYDEAGYTQYRMAYDSDGLRITGLINIPAGDGPFPVVVVNHGFIRYEVYDQGDGSHDIADWLAEYDYITIMPDYRNYGQSDSGPNPFRIGYAIDVMNLIAQLDTLPTADPSRVGVIGHSMGGEVSMWPMVLSDEVDAVVLYASMSGDAARNWTHRWEQWPYQREEMQATALTYGRPADNPEGYGLISPINYLHRVRMPVSIYHGKNDPLVPYWWSEELAALLEEAGKDVTFTGYGGQPHRFEGWVLEEVLQEVLIFLDLNVRGNVNRPG